MAECLADGLLHQSPWRGLPGPDFKLPGALRHQHFQPGNRDEAAAPRFGEQTGFNRIIDHVKNHPSPQPRNVDGMRVAVGRHPYRRSIDHGIHIQTVRVLPGNGFRAHSTGEPSGHGFPACGNKDVNLLRNQRKGRSGRVENGICIRLYSEEDFNQRPPFTQPEIQRSNLADVILRMKAFGLGDIEEFPFLNAPPAKGIRAGYALLHARGAIAATSLATPSPVTTVFASTREQP